MKKLNFMMLIILLISFIGCGSGDDTSLDHDKNSSENISSDFKIMNPDWDYYLGEGSWAYSPTVDKNTLYVTSFYNLYAMNLDGTLKWTFEATPFNSDVTIGNNNTLYLPQRDGSLTAIDNLGNELWKYDTNKSYSQTAAIGCDGTIYFNTTYAIHALDKNGVLKWENDLDYTFGGSISIDNSCNIYTSTNKGIVSFDKDGNKQWFYAFEDENLDAVKIIIDNQNVLYAKTYSSLISVNNSGELLWSYGEDIKGANTPIIDKDGVIYFASSSGMVYAINNNGTLKWTFDEMLKSSDDTGGYLAIGNNGMIYVNTHHYLYALSLDGKIVSQNVHLGGVRSSPILTDGKLYVGIGHYIKSYSLDNEGYQVGSPWPALYHDNNHTGNVSNGN